jgi:hypothetical protein
MSGKPVAEQEIGFALFRKWWLMPKLLMSRRKFLLHYFGEELIVKRAKEPIWMTMSGIQK